MLADSFLILTVRSPGSAAQDRRKVLNFRIATRTTAQTQRIRVYGRSSGDYHSWNVAPRPSNPRQNSVGRHEAIHEWKK